MTVGLCKFTDGKLNKKDWVTETRKQRRLAGITQWALDRKHQHLPTNSTDHQCWGEDWGGWVEVGVWGVGEGSPSFCPSLIPRTVPVLHRVSGSPSEGLIFNCKEQSISTFNIVTMLILVWRQAVGGVSPGTTVCLLPLSRGRGSIFKTFKVSLA